MKNVCVLLSTYNGEKYLQEQLDSLYRQADIKLSILVRDDRSSDETLSLLKENAETHQNLRYFNGRNLGVTQSFFDLLKKAPDADYYAFCDQDDVWDADKLSCAVDMLGKYDPERPALYHSNLRIVDERLRFFRNSHKKPKILPNKYSALANMAATGCTEVFNRAALELLKPRLPEDCVMHDVWVFLVCSFFGEVCYDFIPHISYRQHGDNAVGSGLHRYAPGRIFHKIGEIFDPRVQPRYRDAKSFYAQFGDLLPGEDKEEVRRMAEYKNSLSDRLGLLLDRKIRGKTPAWDILYRLLVLLGIA